MRVMQELSPVHYFDAERKIDLKCYADTYVYHKASGRERNLVAIRFGGYPEQVRALSDAMRKNVGVDAEVEGHSIIIQAKDVKYKKILSHDGIYAEGTIVAMDDDMTDMQEEKSEVERPNCKRRMYIFCAEGDRDELFAEVDKKTSIPMIPEFRDYILDELIKKRILIPLEVLSTCRHFDAYMLNVSNDEKEIEGIVNEGLKTGRISIPKANNSTDMSDITSVSKYLNRYGVTIAQKIKNSFNPLFDPAKEDICEKLKEINANIKKNVGYSLYPAQLAVAEALKRRLDMAKVGIVVAECGSGKTKIGSVALAAHQDGAKTFNTVLCPSHVTKKWVREIEETLPNTKAAVVHSISDINMIYKDYLSNNKSVYLVLSKERARDGYMRKPAAIYSKSKRAYLCPHCYNKIEMEVRDEKNGKASGSKYMVNADQFFFKKENSENHKCLHCGEVLWTAFNPNDKRLIGNKWVKIGGYGFVYRPFLQNHLEQTKNLRVLDRLYEILDNPRQVFIARGAYERYSLSQYIAKHIKQIDGLIADELHLFKGDSGQGDAMENLIGCSKSVIGMTATLINGYSAGLFYLLYRIVPHLMIVDNKPYNNPMAFNREYGVSETVYQLPDANEISDYNANRRSQKKLVREQQKPGVSPLVYSRFLIDCAVFLSLNDMGKHLPDYEEIPVELNLRPDILKEYNRILEAYRNTTKPGNKYARKLMSRFFSLLTTYSDQPYNAEPIFEPGAEEPIIAPKDLSDIDELNEKDIATLDIVERKVKSGGKVLLFTSWVKIDTQEKLTKLLEEKGYKTAVLQPNISPEKREGWVAKQLEKGIDVLITNPSLIETGLDLNAFTTLIFYNVGYNLYTFRQASRRSWRINQTAARVEVYILYFKGTMQERAIKLMATKLAAATLVEGSFSDEGLAAMSDCTDMTSQLARELTMGIRDEVEDVGAMFKKMAIIKDVSVDDSESEFEMVAAQMQQQSVSDKIKRAMELAKQVQQVKRQTKVENVTEFKAAYSDYPQLSLFDELDMAG